MPTIAEIRKQYPQYQDLTDQQLAEGLHRAYYSDIPFDDFAGKIGFAPEPTPEEQSVFRSVADVPVKFGTGIAQGVRFITDAFGADNPVSQNIRSVEDYLQGLLSAQSKQDQAEVARIMKDAEDKGIGAQVVGGLKALATAPLDTLSQAAGTAVPTIIGGLAGGVLRLVAVPTIGALTGAGTIKSSIYDATKQTLLETGATEEQAERTAQQAQEYGGKNLDLILAGSGLGILAAGTGLEKAVANRILGRAAAGKAAEEAAQQGLIRRTAMSAAKEAGPEALQAGQEQFAENVALQREGFDVPTFRGVAGAATLEGAAGAILGGGLGAMGPARPESVPLDPGDLEQRETEEASTPPPPPKPIESAQDLLNAPPRIVAEDAPEALRKEPMNLTDDQVYEEIDQMEQVQEQLASLLFSPEELAAQAAARNVSVEAFSADLSRTYDNLTTRLDVFHKNFMQRMNGEVTVAPAPPAPPAPAPNIQVATTPSVATSTTPAPAPAPAPVKPFADRPVQQELLSEEPAAPAPAPAPTPDVRALALEAIKVRPTIKAISEATGLNQPKAAAVMRGFVDEGIVERYGKAGDRFKLLAPKATETVEAEQEVAVETALAEEKVAEPKPPEMVPAPAGAKVEEMFPRVDSIQRIPFGPTVIIPNVIAEGKPLFRETSADNLLDLLISDKQFSHIGGFVTDDPDLAIGQGNNKGVMVRFRPNSVSGELNPKPGTGVIGGVEYRSDIFAPRAVESITFKNPKRDIKGLRWLIRRVLQQEFTRTDNPDGSVVFTRKAPETPAATPTTPTTETTSEPVSTSAEQVVSGAVAGSPDLSVQRDAAEGLGAAEPSVGGVGGTAPAAERAAEREGRGEPALTEAPTAVEPAQEAPTQTLSESEQSLVHDRLSETQKGVIAKEFGQDSYNDAAKKGFLEEVIKGVNQGITSVRARLRGIVRAIIVGLLSTGAVFNNSAFMNLNAKPTFVTTKSTVTTVEADKPAPPAEAAEAMSPAARATYERFMLDNKGIPFIIADKPTGQIFLFKADGELIKFFPALYGKAAGDVLSHPIGQQMTGQEIDQTLDNEKITPAGDYTAVLRPEKNFGLALFFQDAQGNRGSMAIHQVYTGDIKERRLERLASADATDNKVSYGCINVGVDNWNNYIVPNYSGGARVGVVPDEVGALDKFIPPPQMTVKYTAPEASVTQKVEASPAPDVPGLPRKTERDRNAPQAQRRPSAPTTEQKKEVADRVAKRLAARGTPRGRKGPFGKSKVVVSPRFSPRVDGFIKSIVSQIGLGNTNIIVLDKVELATPEALTATADKYGLYDGFSVEGLVTDATSPNTFGAVMPLPNGQGYALFVDSNTEINVLLENIGHELGHIVEYEALSNADEKTRNAIFNDYLAWLSENEGETTAKLIRKVRAWATAEADLSDLSEDMVLSEKDQEYFKSFAEWFADNVAKWMTTSEKPLSVVEKFFSTLAAKLKRIAAYLTGKRPEFLPSQAVKDFLDGLGTPNDTMAASMIKEAMGFKGPRPIFPSIEGLKNFWDWFSGSKVVDEEGRPIIMYHGSPKVFSVFRPGGRAKAIFLSPDPYFADRFTVDEYDYDVGPIYAVYVNAKNPFDYENQQHIAALEAALAEEFDKSGGNVRATGDFLNWDEMVSAIKDGDWRTIENPTVQKAIKKIGHDGFYVLESMFSPQLGDRVEAKNLAVYEPNQVKSAIGNSGKFSPKANDIRQSRRAGRAALNNVGAAINSQPRFNNKTYIAVRAALDSTRITDAMRSALYMFTSLPQHVQMFAKELPTLKGLLNVLNVRASALKDRKEGLDRNIRKWNDVIKKHIKHKDDFYEIAHESTRLQVEFNNQKFASHPLTQRFNRLPTDLQKMYWEMLASYKGMADEYLTLISKNLSPREANRLQREMAKKRLRVYLPLYREGDYWLRYQDANNETVVQSFKSNYERELAWKEAVANGAMRGSEQMFARVEDFFQNNGPGTFFNRVLDDLKSRNAPEAVKRALYEMYLDQIPASSVRQLYRKRDGYKGYESDLMNVYATVASRMANQLTSLEYVPEIDKAFDEVKQEAKVYAGSGASKNRSVPILINNLEKQIEYLRDPGNGTLVNALSSFSYYWYIIGNISTAVINTTQLPMVVYPMLVGRYGANAASAAMTDATKQYFKGGFDNDNIPGGVKKFPADFSFGIGLPPNSPLGRLYKAAVRQSAIRRSTGYDLVEGRKKNYGMGDYVGLMAKTEQILGWVFQNSERFNREVTLIAAFNLEMKKNGGNVDKAISDAIELVTMSHGTVLTETSPRVFQTGFFKVAFTFKNFAQTQIYLLSKLLREAVRGETPEVKKLAAKQLIGISAMSFVFAGLHGMPFYSAATLLADVLSDMFGDDDDPLKSNEVVRQSVGALAHKGVINELFMADLASRTGFNGLLWRDDDKRLEEVGPVLFAAEQIFGPAYAAGMGFFRAAKDLDEGHVDRALEAATPAAIRNGLKAYRFTVDGAKSRSGELIFDDFNKYELFMQTLGFTPVEVARRSESAGALAGRMNNLTKRKTALLDRLYLARINGDREGTREAVEAIRKFNQNEFVRKTRNVISSQDMQESFTRRRNNTRNSIYGINVPERSRRALEADYKIEDDEE